MSTPTGDELVLFLAVMALAGIIIGAFLSGPVRARRPRGRTPPSVRPPLGAAAVTGVNASAESSREAASPASGHASADVALVEAEARAAELSGRLRNAEAELARLQASASTEQALREAQTREASLIDERARLIAQRGDLLNDRKAARRAHTAAVEARDAHRTARERAEQMLEHVRAERDRLAASSSSASPPPPGQVARQRQLQKQVSELQRQHAESESKLQEFARSRALLVDEVQTLREAGDALLRQRDAAQTREAATRRALAAAQRQLSLPATTADDKESGISPAADAERPQGETQARRQGTRPSELEGALGRERAARLAAESALHSAAERHEAELRRAADREAALASSRATAVQRLDQLEETVRREKARQARVVAGHVQTQSELRAEAVRTRAGLQTLKHRESTYQTRIRTLEAELATLRSREGARSTQRQRSLWDDA